MNLTDAIANAPLPGELAEFSAAKTAVHQGSIGAGAGAALGLLGSGALSAGLIVGGSALVYLHATAPEFADDAPIGQFAWIAAAAALGAAITGALRG